MSRERLRVEAARAAMWTSSKYRDCVDCGTANPHNAPCCGECGGDLEEEAHS